jgi:chromosome segregation ATPase
MDTMTVTTATATERVEKLRKKLATLDTRRHETEAALARERATHGDVTAKRAALTEELAGADAATAGWAHGEIDRLDSALRLSSRVTEGLSNSLSRMIGEIAATTAELTDAQQIVEANRRAEGLKAFAAKLKHAVLSAERDFANLRESLATLNRLASQGVEEYGAPAQGLAETALEAFRHQENNPESFGWRDSRPNYGGFRFSVTPMTRERP